MVSDTNFQFRDFISRMLVRRTWCLAPFYSLIASLQNRLNSADRWRGIRTGTICVLILSLMPIGNAWSKDQLFQIHNAESRLYQGVWLVTALIDFRMSEEALAALDNGVALTFELQFRLDRVRRFWVDKKTATLEQRFELSYQPLSERYVVRNLNSGEQNSYATLFSALNSMGRIVDLPIIDAALLDADDRYELALRAVLDQNTLPGPLRLIAFWSSGFRLESDWYVWMLNA
jgi:hypothetical protein